MTWLMLVALMGGDPITGAAQCAPISDAAERLACYDRLFRPAAGGTAAKPETRSAAASNPPQDEFGLSGRQREQRARDSGTRAAVRIESRVAAIDNRIRDKPVLTLENGQRWWQFEATAYPVFKIGDVIAIRTASLGSYLAAVPGSGPAVRVRRVE